MAEGSGQDTIRGIDIQKAATGFADEEFIFKNFCIQTTTDAREVRWYSKTTTTLDSTDTTGITASQIMGVSQLALPDVVEQGWTRNTSYVRNFKVESPWISEEDIQDSDPDIWATNIKDLVRAVASQVDKYIWNVITEVPNGGALPTPTNINYTMQARGTGWDDLTNGNPILDLVSGATSIRTNSYDISNLIAVIHPTQYKFLLNYLITVKGSSVPQFASNKVSDGVLTNIVGNRIIVSNNCIDGYVVQLVPQMSAKWKSFKALTTAQKIEELIGRKIRIAEEGVCLLEHPKSVHLLSGAA